VNPFTVRLKFHGDLSFFLKSKNAIVERQFREKTSIKDVIESCGVPHPEVDLILVNRQPVDFAYVVERDTDVDVYPVNMRILLPENRLQASHIEKFIADGHLGKLVRDLRLLGFDVVYDPSAEDRQLLRAMKIDNRALLTRDRRLLMHGIVRHGYNFGRKNRWSKRSKCCAVLTCSWLSLHSRVACIAMLCSNQSKRAKSSKSSSHSRKSITNNFDAAAVAARSTGRGHILTSCSRALRKSAQA
jgi:Mut7-C ubiquitin/Mut7-C RNAse domain